MKFLGSAPSNNEDIITKDDALAETTTTIGSLISGATDKATPVDADHVGLSDSAASNILKKLSWANIKATIKTYFDTLYATLSAANVFTDKQTILKTTEQLRIGYDASNYETTTVDSFGNSVRNLNQSTAFFQFSKLVIFGEMASNSTVENANLYTGLTGFIKFNSSQAAYLYGGASTVSYRVGERGSGTDNLGNGTAYGGHIIGAMTFGTHSTAAAPWASALVVRPATWTINGTGSVVDWATVYIDGVSGSTVTGIKYALYVASGLSRFDTIKITGGSPGSGKVLTSDADGDATWENPGAAAYTVVNVITTSSSPAQTSGEIIILVDAATAGGAVTINLPTAVGNTAKFTIKKIDSGANTVTVDANSTQTIDGDLTDVIEFENTAITLVSNNANWFKI